MPNLRSFSCRQANHILLYELSREAPSGASPLATRDDEVKDEDVEKLLDYFLKVIPPAVSDFFGIKLRPVRLSKSKRRKLVAELKELILGAKELESIKPPFSTTSEWVTALDTLDKALKPFLDPRDRKMHIANYIRTGYIGLIQAPNDVSYFRGTSYKVCCEALDVQATELFRLGRQSLADKMFYEFSLHPDSGTLTQGLIVHVPRIMTWLQGPRRTFSKLTLDRLVKYYSELSGYYEKSLHLVVGMLQAKAGAEPSYARLVKCGLADSLGEVSVEAPILARGFNITVRNSLAHGSHYFHYHTGSIDFHDRNGKSVTWSFRELFNQCRALSATTMASLMCYFVFQARRWEIIWDTYRSAHGIT